MAVYIYKSNSGDGWRNLAADRYFLENLGPDDIMLYFYINDNAVIIGRNQNAWKECNVRRMDEEGVQLVRRHTGGGAVYHDRGNLNFSFIMGEKHYDVARQMGVIVKTMRKLGLAAEASGRNDILIDGKKFSGNAFGVVKEMCGHHGTLLVSADLSKLGNYLNVSEKKIRSKGIASVRSRVVNLCELDESITVEQVEQVLRETFAEEYGAAQDYLLDEAAEQVIAKLYEEQSSWEWRLGNTMKFDFQVDDRFSFGDMQILLTLQKGVVSEAKVYTDALDTGLAEKVAKIFPGVRFDVEDMAAALEAAEQTELAEYFRNMEL